MSDIDEKQLLDNCKQFDLQVRQLKDLKLENQIKNYQQQCNQEYQNQLQLHTKIIQEEFDNKIKSITKNYDEYMNKLTKNKMEINKQIHAYKTIMDDLEQRKNKVKNQFNQNLHKLSKHKEHCVSDWKKNSNDNIKKMNYLNYLNKKPTTSQHQSQPLIQISELQPKIDLFNQTNTNSLNNH